MASVRKKMEIVGWATYISDSMQASPQGKYLTKRWYDVAFPAREDERDGDEIAAYIVDRLNSSQQGGD